MDSRQVSARRSPPGTERRAAPASVTPRSPNAGVCADLCAVCVGDRLDDCEPESEPRMATCRVDLLDGSYSRASSSGRIRLPVFSIVTTACPALVRAVIAIQPLGSLWRTTFARRLSRSHSIKMNRRSLAPFEAHGRGMPLQIGGLRRPAMIAARSTIRSTGLAGFVRSVLEELGCLPARAVCCGAAGPGSGLGRRTVAATVGLRLP